LQTEEEGLDGFVLPEKQCEGESESVCDVRETRRDEERNQACD